jgi:hypothetical protein
MPGSDASSDRNAVTDSSSCCDAAPTDSAQQPDVAEDSAVTDALTSTDAGADSSADVVLDAVTDAGRDAASDGAADALADAMADGNTCPAAAPMDGSSCTVNALVCMYTGASGEFTQCSCNGSSWMCFTVVPGPLPPPELLA